MLAAFIEAVLRSLILALIVWAALRIFRIQNVVSQRNAWITVLVGSLLMPFALPFSARWHILPLATIPTPTSLNRIQTVLAPTIRSTVSGSHSLIGSINAAPEHDQVGALRTGLPIAAHNSAHAASSEPVLSPYPTAASVQPVAARWKLSLFGAALLAYILIAGILLARLLVGLACALRLWYSSTPVSSCGDMQFSEDFKLRFSHRISTPVTIGSGVVLPAGYTSWTEEKLRVVLAHERSHVDMHDFHFQILASLYAVLTWFSPLGWWLKRNLSDLGEAISDRSGLRAASNRSAYAQILLEFAAAPRLTLTGVAMARPSSISRRIEQLFNDIYLRQAFSGGAPARVAVLVLPALLFATGAIVRVHAATQSNPVAMDSNAPAAAAQSAQTVAVLTAQPETSLTLRAQSIPATATNLAAQSAPVLREVALANPPAPPAPAMASMEDSAKSEATFDRSLSFNGTLDLSVSTASGNITFTRGTANQVRIHGIVKANRNGDLAQVRQIAANPPIEQNGNTVRIGSHQQDLHNISISYEIEAPADAILNASSASGDIADTGVGIGAKLNAASGNIKASGLQGGFKVQTASGDIGIENAGAGDAWAETGSGDIDLNGVSGALTAQTGSGTIKAAGKPSSPWKLQTGSGDIQLTTGSAPMDLDASTGSGNISALSSKTMQSSGDHHHLRTQLNGGGPEVRAETGSGDIRIN